MNAEQQHSGRAGLAYGLAAYAWWGSAVPIYLHALSQGTWSADPMELLAQRVWFGLPLVLGLLALRGRMGELRAALGDRRMLGTLLVSSALLVANWFAFIWAVGNDRLLDSSLGYYLNPLVSVALGMLVLGERPRRLQLAAIGMCVVAVAWLTYQRGSLPWVAVTVALSFGMYGLVRKRATVKPMPGLCVELIILLPLMAGIYAALFSAGRAEILDGRPVQMGLMALSGVMIVVPLLWFAAAAHRLRLATLGMLQYIGPSGQFLLALYYGEALNRHTLATFVVIWIALGLYSWDAWRGTRGTG
ncbi:MAG: EamA family transporter RarD [Planctomycetota bacterium]